MDTGTFNTVVVTEVDGTASVNEGVEADGAEAGVGVASGMAAGEFVVGAFVVAMLLPRLI